MRHVHLVIALLGGLCLASSIHAQAPPTPPNAADIEERILMLQQQIQDHQSDIRIQEQLVDRMENDRREAEADITRAIQRGGGGVVEQMRAQQAISAKYAAQKEINHLKSAIRQCESEIRQLRSTSRQPPTQKPIDTPVPAAATTEQGQKIQQELERLKGSWRGQVTELLIQGNQVRIFWVIEGQGLQQRNATIELDPEKGHLDFNLGNGQVVRNLYRLEKLKDGRPVLITQFTRGNVTVRPNKWKFLWEVDPDQGEVYEFLPEKK